MASSSILTIVPANIHNRCYDTCKTAEGPIAPLCAPVTSSWTTIIGPVPTKHTTTTKATTTAVPPICVDYVNKCGQTYGGCFPSTNPFPTFSKPSCSLETPPPVTTVKPHEPVTTAVPTICVDTVDLCGNTYGGCFPYTTPYPTFSKPSCSLETEAPPLTTAVPTICEDTVDLCGNTYGGCFPSTSPFPTFTGPYCSLETKTPSTTTVKPREPITTAVPTICVDTVDLCGNTYGGCFAYTTPYPTFPKPSCSLETEAPPLTTAVPTICEDTVDLCGNTYGGCFASTSPYPTFKGPSCSLETTTPPVTQVPVTTGAPTVCVDTINACGKTYGGCFASTSPFPTFSDPGCP